MKKNAGLVSAIIGIVTGIQIIGQIVVARIFGAQVELDAFVSAVTIPTILTTVIAGTLNDAFLPILKKKQQHHEEEGNVYFVKLVILLGIVSIGISMLLHLLSLPLINLMFGARGIAFSVLTNHMMVWMVYTLPFTLINTFGASYLYSKNKFMTASLAYLVGSILNLAIIILFSHVLGIWSMVVAFILAIIIQLIIVFPYHLTRYVSAAFPLVWTSASYDEFIIFTKAWIPLIISSFAVRFDGILTRSFASHLPEGYIVYTNLASKLFSGLVGIMTIGLQIVFFPHLLDLVHSENLKDAKTKVFKAKLVGTLLTVAIILVIVFIAPFFMHLLLTGGKFSGKNVDLLISMFPYFILPAIGWGVSQLFFQPVIAIRKQHLLTVINVCAVGLSWLIASLTLQYAGGLTAISVGLTILTFTGIIGAETIWQIHLTKKSA